MKEQQLQEKATPANQHDEQVACEHQQKQV